MQLLNGCVVPVAPFYDEPLPKDGLAQLQAGASGDEVVALLGEPHITRVNGKFWYYGGTRPLVGVIGPNGSGAILDYNWIEVAFDDDSRLQYAEHYESKSGCARSGNCLLWGAWGAPVSNVMTEEAIISSPPDNDKNAKMFKPPDNGCAIYVFFTSRMALIGRALLQDNAIAVGVGETKPSWLNIDTYIRVEVPPGFVEISAGPATHLLVSKKQWTCRTNDVAYFWVQGSFSGTDRIEKVDADRGKMEVTRRRLLLPP